MPTGIKLQQHHWCAHIEIIAVVCAHESKCAASEVFPAISSTAACGVYLLKYTVGDGDNETSADHSLLLSCPRSHSDRGIGPAPPPFILPCCVTAAAEDFSWEAVSVCTSAGEGRAAG